VNGTLCAVSRLGLTALEALAWWRADRDGGDPVGFGISAKAATWWRLSGATPLTAQGEAVELDRVYEVVAFDGERELRWRNDDAGRGRAVVLADRGDLLPPGDDASYPGRTEVFGPVQTRVLAGKVNRIDGIPGWVRLAASRYAPAEIPVALPAGFEPGASGGGQPVAVVDVVEYAAEDSHGNVSIVDRRLSGLRMLRRSDLELRLDRKEA